MRYTPKTRFLAMLLAVVMVMGLLPMGYPADDAKPLDLHFQYRDMDDMVEFI